MNINHAVFVFSGNELVHELRCLHQIRHAHRTEVLLLQHLTEHDEKEEKRKRRRGRREEEEEKRKKRRGRREEEEEKRKKRRKRRKRRRGKRMDEAGAMTNFSVICSSPNEQPLQRGRTR